MKIYLAQKCTDDFYGIYETLYVGTILEQAKKSCFLSGIGAYYFQIEEWHDGVCIGIGVLNMSTVTQNDFFDQVMGICIGSLK